MKYAALLKAEVLQMLKTIDIEGRWYSPGTNVRLADIPVEDWIHVHQQLPNLPLEDVAGGFVNIGALNIPTAAARMASAEENSHRGSLLSVYDFRKIGMRWLYLPESLGRVMALLSSGRWLDVETFEAVLGKDGRSQIASLRQMGFTVITRRKDREQADPSSMFDTESVSGHMAQWLLVGKAFVGGSITGGRLEGVKPLSSELPAIDAADKHHLKILEERFQTSLAGLQSNLNKWESAQFMPTPYHQLSLEQA